MITTNKNFQNLKLLGNKSVFKTASLVLALISIVYEFALAQTISLLYGSTFTIYSLTIGIYTFALGFGAMCFDAKKHSDNLAILNKTELGLSVTALVAPFFIILSSAGFLGAHLGSAVYVLIFIPVLVCGFLSGIELPCLLSLNKDNKESILLWDYLGMFLGSLFFGLYGLEKLGAIQMFWVMSILNIITMVTINFILLNKKKYVANMFFALLLLANTLLILNHESVFDLFRAAHGF